VAPATLPLASLQRAIDTPIDLFVCCASFEGRSRSIADAIDPQAVTTALVAENREKSRYVAKSAQYLRSRFGDRAVSVPISMNDPIVTADGLARALDSALERLPASCLVDITTFTHESLLILFKLLCERASTRLPVSLAYTCAEEYGYDHAPEQKWLSKGVREVRSILGYPGEVLPSRRTHLIVLVGYEYERASRLIEVFQPSALSIGHGLAGTATREKHQQANEHFHKLVKTSSSKYGKVSEFTFSCSDPIAAKTHIAGCIAGLSELNHVIAPMNTKLSTVGAALVVLENESVQLCYAQPVRYNTDDYSMPGDTCHLLSLNELVK